MHFFASFKRRLIDAPACLQQTLMWACLALASGWQHIARLCGDDCHSRYHEQTGGSGVGRCYPLI